MEAPSRSSPERGGAGYCSGPVCAPAASGSPAPRRGNEAAEWEGAVSRVSEEEGTPGCLGTHPLAPDCCFCLPTFLLRKSLSIGAEEHCHHNALAPELVGLTSLPFPTMIRSREIMHLGQVPSVRCSAPRLRTPVLLSLRIPRGKGVGLVIPYFPHTHTEKQSLPENQPRQGGKQAGDWERVMTLHVYKQL